MKFLMLALGGLLITLQGLSNCPDRNAKDNFDGSAFSGTWYVVRAVRPPPRMQSRCTHVVVTQRRGDDLGLSTRFYSNVISQYSTFSGVLQRVEPSSQNAKFIYTRPGLYSEESARYTIMDTDYTNYAVVSFCASSKRSALPKKHREEVTMYLFSWGILFSAGLLAYCLGRHQLSTAGQVSHHSPAPHTISGQALSLS
uniref:Lipocalin/cytosolic fatty-acid binding domain-containing protein n=2 Tax=Timema TaxID=61471 RepID=A0A7R9IMK8_9NEOP|nr:unnamed protein product [Timema bartmani]CAD7461114.1 unnamed protein product [Timema tahoe]